MAYNTSDRQFKRYVYVKRRIGKAQFRAKTVGVLYSLATVALLALFLMPNTLGMASSVPLVGILQTAATVLAAICVLLCVCKLRWLFARKASRLYGFNRNAFAMDDMGKYFSFTLATLFAYFYLAAIFDSSFVVGQTAQIAFIALLVVHIVLGIVGGTVSVFDTTEGIVEHKRERGFFVPVLRNLVQLAATAFIVKTLLGVGAASVALAKLPSMLAGETQLADLLKDFEFIGFAVTALAALFMIYYATGTKEYDLDGPKTPGRKWFMLWALLALVGAAVAYLFPSGDTGVAMLCAIAAAAALLFELITVACPHVKRAKVKEKRVREEKRAYPDLETNAYIRANIGNVTPIAYTPTAQRTEEREEIAYDFDD